MKTLTFGSCLVAFWLAGSSCLAVTDLLTNGNFDTGALAPWTVTNGTASVVPGGGSFVCNFDGVIEQTVTFPEESDFYLSLDILQTGSASPGQLVPLILTVEKDGVEILSEPIFLEPQSFRADHVARTFRASAGTATVRVLLSSGVIDNVRLIELVPQSFAGGYKGSAKITLTTSVTADSEEIRLSTNEKVVARIEPNGRFAIIHGKDVIYGILFDDDTFDLASQGVRQTGTAAIHGKRIQFTLPYSHSEGLNREFNDEGHDDINLNSQIVITLNRVAR